MNHSGDHQVLIDQIIKKIPRRQGLERVECIMLLIRLALFNSIIKPPPPGTDSLARNQWENKLRQECEEVIDNTFRLGQNGEFISRRLSALGANPKELAELLSTAWQQEAKLNLKELYWLKEHEKSRPIISYQAREVIKFAKRASIELDVLGTSLPELQRLLI